MTKLDIVLKSREITVLIKVHLVKAMVFPLDTVLDTVFPLDTPY